MASQSVNNNDVESAQRLRILAVADVVQPQLYNYSIKDWLPHIDLIVSCGDLPPDYLDFLITVIEAPMVHVIGNHCSAPHDPSGCCSPDAYPGAYDLNGRAVVYNGLILAGAEGGPDYNRGPHQYTEQQMAWMLTRLYPTLLRKWLRTGRFLDVLVTHTPPRGVNDYTDPAHRGFESLVGFVERFKPVLLLHGHSHRYDPMRPMHSRLGETDIINVYGHCIIELERDGEESHWRLQSPVLHEGR